MYSRCSVEFRQIRACVVRVRISNAHHIEQPEIHFRSVPNLCVMLVLSRRSVLLLSLYSSSTVRHTLVYTFIQIRIQTHHLYAVVYAVLQTRSAQCTSFFTICPNSDICGCTHVVGAPHVLVICSVFFRTTTTTMIGCCFALRHLLYRMLANYICFQ